MKAPPYSSGGTGYPAARSFESPVCLRPIAVPPRGWAPPKLNNFSDIGSPKREFHFASLPWAQIETKKPRCRPDRTFVPL